MTTYLFANFAKSTLAENVGIGALEIKINPLDADKFPQPNAGEAFRFTISDGNQAPEIVECSSNPLTGTLTVTRGLEGTVDSAWQAGSLVVHGITAGTVSEVPATSTGLTLSGALNEADGGTVASATSVDLNSVTGNSLVISGTTTITSFGTAQAGVRKIVKFSGILTLIHSSNLVLPNNGGDILTSAGDWGCFVSAGSGIWNCVSYTRANGTPLRVVGTLLGNTGSNDNRLLRSDGTGGSTIQASSVTVDDSGNMSGVVDLAVSGTLSCGLIASGVDTIASATTTDLSTVTGNSILVTGTSSISSFGIVDAGAEFILTFADTLTVVHHSSSLVIPGSNDLVVTVGDVVRVVSVGSGDWKVLGIHRANGYAEAGAPARAALVGTGYGNKLGLSYSLVPVAAVIDYAGSTAPTGFLLTYGQAVSRTTYATLFSVIGTTYGSGDGSTTFNLPDVRGRTRIGKDDMGGTAANRVTSGISGINALALGATGGSQYMHQHTHGVTDPGHTHGTNAGATRSDDASSHSGANGVYYTPGTASTSSTTGVSIQNAGTGTSQNVQPGIVMNAIICYE